jgi:hypothetical protein
MSKQDPETVTISRKEYDQLQKDAAMLNALENCGVDNWEGYSEAWRARGASEAWVPAAHFFKGDSRGQ